MSWPSVPLREVCQIQSGGTPLRSNSAFYGGEIPWAKISDVESSNGQLFKTEEALTEAGLSAIRGRLFPPGSLLLAMYGSVGKVTFARVLLATNQAILGIQIKDDQLVFDRFLYHWLKYIQPDLQSLARGVTQKNLSAELVRELPFPLPPMEEQKRIAAILDKADAIRSKREQAIKLTDEFLRSLFLDMFGDPLQNPMKWPVVRLSQIASVDRGRFSPRPRDDPRYYGGPYPFIQTGDIRRSGREIEIWTQTLNQEGFEVSRFFPIGTIAVAIAANIGDSAVLSFGSCFPDSVVGVQVDPKKAAQGFVAEWLRFQRERLIATAPETAQKNINLESLRPLLVVVPPLGLQSKFASCRAQILSQRAKISHVKRHVGSLNHTLTRLAFTGGI